jgi:hypothetical protein
MDGMDGMAREKTIEFWEQRAEPQRGRVFVTFSTSKLDLPLEQFSQRNSTEF